MKNSGSNNQIRTVVHAILGGVSAAASAPLFAQNAAAAATDTQGTGEQLQEVVITGIRASLQKSLDIKQQTVGVVDAISAEDIGQFPDATIGSAISRIPGVTVDRGAVNLQTAAGAAVSPKEATRQIPAYRLESHARRPCGEQVRICCSGAIPADSAL